MSRSVQISAVVITYNEEAHIGACIESLLQVVEEVVVVDSFSSDQTVAIAKSKGARVFEHVFEGHIQQKNFAIDQADHDVVLSLDADERLSERMQQSILEVKQHWTYDGYSFNRLNNYCGKWLRHSWYPDRKIRLWDRRKGRWGGTNPHDTVIIKGSVLKLKGDILHYAYSNLEEHYKQVLSFAIIAANAKHRQGKKAYFLIHVLLSSALKFVKRYIFRLGFLDGYYGFIFSALAAYVNFAKYLRLWELGRSKR